MNELNTIYLNEKKFYELETYNKVLEFKQEIEEIAKKAIDEKLIESWYYNGKKFVVIFKD